MSEHTRNELAARQAWFFIGKLAILTFGILLCIVALKFFTEHKLAPKNSGLGGELSQHRVDLLLIGSSHTRKSYDMRQLEKSTGVDTSFLMSYDGADLSSISQMLDYLVTRPAHCPRYLVVEAYSTVFGRKPGLEDPRYFIEAPPTLKVTIIRSYLSERHYAVGAFLDIFDLIVNRGNDEIVAYPFYSWATKTASYKGGRTDFVFPGVSEEVFRQFKVQLYASDPNSDQIAALNRILDVVHHHNIAAIFIDTPLPEPVSLNPAVQALKKDFRDIVSARRYPYVDGDRGFPIDDPSMFEDNNHLSSRGRDVFTSRISVELKSWMDSQIVSGSCTGA
jgi:hypothetical protein